jgi:hypothetical protein
MIEQPPIEAVPPGLIVPIMLLAWAAYFLLRHYNREN